MGLKVAPRRAIPAFCASRCRSSAELIKRVEHGGTMEMSQNQPGQS